MNTFGVASWTELQVARMQEAAAANPRPGLQARAPSCRLDGGWQRCEDGLGIWAVACLDGPAGNINVTVPTANRELAALCKEPLQIELQPGAPKVIKWSIAPYRH